MTPLPYMEDGEFEKLVNDGISSIKPEFISELKNVAIVIADFPSPDQLQKVRARPGTTLFGLYEGIPRTRRGNNYSGVLPDKITVFKLPLLSFSADEEVLKANVAETVWHEIAHHFGLDHHQIYRRKQRKKQ